MKVKQRGSGWSIKLVFSLYQLFGYRFIYYLMYPVSYFYFLKATNVKNALKEYYTRIGISFNKKVHHEHLRHFAICMCDRFVSLVEPASYTYKIAEKELLLEKLEKGGILLLSHFGGWASAAYCFNEYKIKMNIVMEEVLMQSIKKIEEEIKTINTEYLQIIDTSKGSIDVALKIAHAISHNELIAMMVDRATSPKHLKSLTFFGKQAGFNKNPFEIAYKTQKPLVALFVRYIGIQEYSLHYYEIQMNTQLRMADAVQEAMEKYVHHFEENLKAYPQGWFNFYNFWENKG